MLAQLLAAPSPLRSARGIDLDARQGFGLPNNWGTLTFDAKYTYLDKWERTERDGTTRDYAQATYDELRRHGIHDRALARLIALARKEA